MEIAVWDDLVGVVAIKEDWKASDLRTVTEVSLSVDNLQKRNGSRDSIQNDDIWRKARDRCGY
jgi:hypothetical protein